MEPFTTLKAIAAPFDMADIDSDMLIPQRYLRKPLTVGYRNFLFYMHRFDDQGKEKPDFVLNKPAYRQAKILVAGENFGMGSSRPIGEVMRGAGIAAVIAESINGLAMRTCVNSSLPAINCAGVSALFNDGDVCRVDFLSGKIDNLTSGKSLQTHPMAPLLAEIVAAGGVVPMLLKEGYIHAEPFMASSS